MYLLSLSVLVLAALANASDKSDTCSLPAETGLCRGAFPKFFFNKDTQKCERFIYGGCGGNENNFGSLEECQGRCSTQDVCDQPREVGPCRAAFPKFFFNKQSGKCEKFIYGGCHGNGNNFDTAEECQKACPSEKTEDVCQQPKTTGLCKAYIPSYYYNSASGKCEKFVYGGCGGNENRFGSLDACEKRCGKKDVDVCQQPKATGPCRAAVPRFYFNSENGQCEHFIYGGCKGNGNNFGTAEDCQKACAPRVTRGAHLCELPREVGPCRGSIPRWFHNSVTGKCETFIYGGCRGNKNNFKSKAECKSAC